MRSCTSDLGDGLGGDPSAWLRAWDNTCRNCGSRKARRMNFGIAQTLLLRLRFELAAAVNEAKTELWRRTRSRRN
jgi:hypothetical protein